MKSLIAILIADLVFASYALTSLHKTSLQRWRKQAIRHGSERRLGPLDRSDQAFEDNTSTKSLRTEFQETLEAINRMMMPDANLLRHLGLDGERVASKTSKQELRPVFFVASVAPFGVGWITIFIWAVLVLLFGYYYQSNKASIIPHLMGDPEQIEWAPMNSTGAQGEWTIGMFQVYEEPKLLLFSCCCGAVRWADTVSMAGFISFSSALALFVGLTLISSFGYAWLLFVGVLTLFRQRLRAEYDIPYGNVFTIAEDCCAYCWCSACALTQEAIHSERAKKEVGGWLNFGFW